MVALLLTTLLALSTAAMAAPGSPNPSPTPDYNLVCGVYGFTSASADYKETTFQASGATLESCYCGCEKDDDCKSFSFAKKYGSCYFFNRRVAYLDLQEDKTSYFEHFDKGCYITDTA